MVIATSKARVAYHTAFNLAEDLIELLAPACERIEIAGSIRRGLPLVGDIELLAVPRFADYPSGLFGEMESVNELDLLCDRLHHEGVLRDRLDKNGHRAWGARFKRAVYHLVPVDLFVVLPPAQWGVLFMIRTGPADFSRRLVTHTDAGGLLPINMAVKDGVLWRVDASQAPRFAPLAAIDTPEEYDVFTAIGVPYMAPKDRV